jgi:ornithine carbamoyltransferase
MTESSGGRVPHELAYCFMGDGRFNMGRSLLVTGAILGADVRICAPEALWPDKDVRDMAHERAEESGARITLTAGKGDRQDNNKNWKVKTTYDPHLQVPLKSHLLLFKER